MVLNAKATIDKHMEGGLYKVVPNFLLSDEYPELVLIPTIHNVEITETQCIPYILLNLSEEGIFLRKGEILRHLEKEDITVEEITTETMLQSENMEPTKLNCEILSAKAFITSLQMLTHIEKSSYRMQKFWSNIRRSLRKCVRNIKIYSQKILQTEQ